MEHHVNSREGVLGVTDVGTHWVWWTDLNVLNKGQRTKRNPVNGYLQYRDAVSLGGGSWPGGNRRVGLNKKNLRIAALGMGN